MPLVEIQLPFLQSSFKDRTLNTQGSRLSRQLSRLNTWTKNAMTVKDRWGASFFMQFKVGGLEGLLTTFKTRSHPQQILFVRSLKTRRFETLSTQDFAQVCQTVDRRLHPISIPYSFSSWA